MGDYPYPLACASAHSSTKHYITVCFDGRAGIALNRAGFRRDSTSALIPYSY